MVDDWGGVPTPNYDEIDGTFSMLCPTSSSTTDYAGWVGLGGLNSSNLLQAGWDDYQKRAWVEILPYGPLYNSGSNLVGSCGHRLYVDINYNVNNISGAYVYIHDNNNGWTWNTFTTSNGTNYLSYATTCDESSAEWIDEKPKGVNNLANFVDDNFYGHFKFQGYTTWEDIASGERVYEQFLGSDVAGPDNGMSATNRFDNYSHT